MSVRPPSQERPDFNPSLNGYRGVCTLVVFFYHLFNARVAPWPSGSPTADAVTFVGSSLRYGVEMFFMISGFVILGSLLRHPTVGGFLKDRFIRIYSAWVPALIAVTAICIVFGLKVFADASPLDALGLFVVNLLLLPPLIPLPMIHLGSWSLTYEWAFYLTAAAGVLIFRRESGSRWLTILWVALAAGFICAFPRSLFFLTGVLVFRYREWFAERSRMLGWPLLSLLVFLVAWRFTDAGKAEFSETLIDMLFDGRWIAVVVAFVAALHMFASVCLNASRQFVFLNSRTFQFLGTISYSFYLWHSLVMSFVKRVTTPLLSADYGPVVSFAVFALASLAISLLVAWASWSIFETRLARLARRALGSRTHVGRTVNAV